MILDGDALVAWYPFIARRQLLTPFRRCQSGGWLVLLDSTDVMVQFPHTACEF